MSQQPPPPKKDDRAERLAQQLRANLRRRKAQARVTPTEEAPSNGEE